MEGLTKGFVAVIFKIWNRDTDEDTKWEKSYPNWRPPRGHQAKLLRNWKTWMDSKREEEGAEGLWRIYDGLYDLESWVPKHPGGESWIRLTKGTDITEAFEAHHISGTAEAILPKYFVRKANSPRNSPFTFHPDGFYRTLKERVRLHLINVKKGPATPSKVIADSLAGMTLATCIASAYLGSFALSILSGLFLTLTVITSHNFFHQRDNWRMYYFNFSLMSYRDWRVSHGMSHHIYPNSVYDLEVDMFDPLFQWLPRTNKTFFARYISWLYSPIIYSFIFHFQFLSRILSHPDGLYELVQLVVPAAMFLSLAGPLQVIILWNFTILSASFFFGWIGINAAHHHPDLFHDGDNPRNDKDWGLYQLDAVRDRVEVKGVLPLVLTLFGDHSLHHLFPTVDHYHLDSLYPILEETCREFNYQFKLTTTLDLVKGQFLQLARNQSKSHVEQQEK